MFVCGRFDLRPLLLHVVCVRDHVAVAIHVREFPAICRFIGDERKVVCYQINIVIGVEEEWCVAAAELFGVSVNHVLVIIQMLEGREFVLDGGESRGIGGDDAHAVADGEVKRRTVFFVEARCGVDEHARSRLAIFLFHRIGDVGRLQCEFMQFEDEAEHVFRNRLASVDIELAMEGFEWEGPKIRGNERVCVILHEGIFAASVGIREEIGSSEGSVRHTVRWGTEKAGKARRRGHDRETFLYGNEKIIQFFRFSFLVSRYWFVFLCGITNNEQTNNE